MRQKLQCAFSHNCSVVISYLFPSGDVSLLLTVKSKCWSLSWSVDIYCVSGSLVLCPHDQILEGFIQDSGSSASGSDLESVPWR